MKLRVLLGVETIALFAGQPTCDVDERPDPTPGSVLLQNRGTKTVFDFDDFLNETMEEVEWEAEQEEKEKDEEAEEQTAGEVEEEEQEDEEQGELALNADMTDRSPWSQIGTKKKCSPEPPLKKWVKTQDACQKLAEERGHTYFQYYKQRKKCGTTNTCVTQQNVNGWWKIFKRAQSAEEKTEEEKAEAAAAIARAAAAAEQEKIRQITESWPRTPWPQCGFGKHMCVDEKIPVHNKMSCQARALTKGHAYYQYSPYKHFGLCGTSADCERPGLYGPVPWPYKTGGETSDWTIYTWGSCVEWTTRTTTTTTTVIQAQEPADTIMGAKKAVGGCSDPGKRPYSVGDNWVAGSALGYGLEKRVFKVPGSPHDTSKQRLHSYGPWRTRGVFNSGFFYGHGSMKQFFPVSRQDGKEGVVWIDATNRKAYMTWFAGDLDTSESKLLYTPEDGGMVVAATSNGQDGIVLLTGQDSAGYKTKTDRHSVAPVYAYRYDSLSGALVKKVEVPNMKVWSLEGGMAGGSATWDVDTNTVAFLMARQLPMMNDGKNHQATICVLLDGFSLSIKHANGLSTSHSFANTIVRAERNDTTFFSIELGDANPRGIHVQRYYRHLSRITFDSDGEWSFKWEGKVPYVPKLDDPYQQVPAEMSHPGLTDVEDGLLILFTGEQLPEGSKQKHAPRDIGFVKISSDLRTIMSPGTNRGINFITKHTSESASRLKTFKLSSGRVLLSYEMWSPHDYLRTEFMELDKDGNVVRAKWEPCEKMRLPIGDDPIVRNGKGIAYTGSSEGLIRYEICAGDECSAL